MSIPLARRLAAPAAIAAVIGAVGWVAAPAMARGASGPWLLPATAVIALIVGGLVYTLVARSAAQQLAPLDALTRAMREAAARPRDHIAVFRRLRSGPVGGDPQTRAVVDGAMLLLRRIEERQAQQTAWLGSLVHDVRTPIVAAANTMGVLGRNPSLGDMPEVALLRQLAGELRDLAGHVQSVLDAVRLERDDVDLELEPVDLAEVAAAVCERAGSSAGVRIVASGSGSAMADRPLLERALANLVGNSARYARSRVDVKVFPGLLRVEDDGPGLPAPLEELAVPFRSEAAQLGSETVATGSAGMGLFVARRVMELHRGKLVVERSDAAGTVLLAYVGVAAASHAR